MSFVTFPKSFQLLICQLLSTVLGPFHNEHYSDDEYTHDAYYDDEYTHDAHSDNTDVNDQYTYDAYSDNTDSDDSDFDHGFAYDEYPYYDSSQHEAYNSPSSSKQKLLLRGSNNFIILDYY